MGGNDIPMDDESIHHVDRVHASPSVLRKVDVVDPLWVQLQKGSCKVEDILKHVLERDYIFIPTLHSGHYVTSMTINYPLWVVPIPMI